MVVTPLWIDDGFGPAQNPALTQDAFNAGLTEMCAANVNELWQTATNYQNTWISDAAFSLVAIGVMQKGPISTAIYDWINSIWTLYYTNKTQITYTYNASLLDFSSCGPMPYSVPQLEAEVTPIITAALQTHGMVAT
jgi:hypothetical protein